jgi:hypothetical protein
MLDMQRKARRRGVGGERGEAHHQARLRESDVINIRNSPESNSALARVYGTTLKYIWAIRHRYTWKHI